MGKSDRLNLTDIRAVVTLVGECRDLGDAAGVWRSHLLAGLARLTGAGIGFGGEMAGCVGGNRRDLGTADWGWGNGFDRAALIAALTEFQQDPLYNLLMNAYIERLPGADGTCLSRTQMLSDREWYRSAYFCDIHRAMGIDASLVCFHSVPGARDEFGEVFLCRAVGERDFAARDRTLVRATQAAIAPLVGGPLARFDEPSPADLPPRTRQVLRCLLEGDSDKQIAARLGISAFTVNGHTKLIYQHFGVVGRAELLARWVRRGWGSRCAWSDPV